ncbi:MAG: hypothetical protein K1Y02_09410 [Candidatus Hydrogenedentes bacterium]|nr:hypothetical protein [Candidatus Hydrogenedentota bacterium]
MGASLLLVAFAACLGSGPDAYDVVWTSPSADSSGSMPLGNGDIGVNLWMEPSGDLLFYVSKTDAWDDNCRLLKLGRVRVSLTPNPFAGVKHFRQTLKLEDGAVSITSGRSDSIRIWVDANHPAVRVEARTSDPTSVVVALEPWRTEKRALGKDEAVSAYGMMEAPHPVYSMPDVIFDDADDTVLWCHSNETSIWRETMDLQGMGSWAAERPDPLLFRTFGGMIAGDGLVKRGKLELVSPTPRRTHDVNVYCLSTVPQQGTPTIDVAAVTASWRQRIAAIADADRTLNKHQSYSDHRAWWHDFWNRSWIHADGKDQARETSQGYALQRFMTACAGRGASPIKFNGSIFTVDAREGKETFDADYRRWGGPYWFQNTRLIYWPLMASGDFDMAAPLFRMYTDALPFAEARTQTYFGHDGAFFPETMYFWGAYANDNYGWDRAGKPVSLVDNRYIRWYWTSQLELIALMLDHHAHTQDASFLRDTLLPFAETALEFFDKHYARDAAGKILLKPGQALETWQDVVNPAPDIAGLQYVLSRLIELPPDAFSESQRTQWQRMLSETPDLPTRDLEGVRMLAPAQEILADRANSENAELYAVFPFRIFGVGKPDLELARKTFEHREVKGNRGWNQDAVQAALLGMADTAADLVADRFVTHHEGSRFPAFWGPNFDWIPDQDHGCNGVLALQTMLIQSEGKTIRLFPAWPKSWDVDFKVHAPYQTTVEGRLKNGRLERLKVHPQERLADVEVMLPRD